MKLFHKYEIKKLDELLQNISNDTRINENPIGKLNIYSTFKDVALFYCQFEKFELDYKQRKENAPNWHIALKKLIIEMKNSFRDYNDERLNYFDDPPKYFLTLIGITYERITEGKMPTLYDYGEEVLVKIFRDDLKDYYDIMFSSLDNIAKGVVYAYELPKLEKELAELEKQDVENLQTELLLEPQTKKNQNDTTFKTQILILIQLGIFDKEKFINETLENKGKFISKFLNMSLDNAKDYIGNMHNTNGKSGSKSPYNATSISQANEILSLLNLPQIENKLKKG